MSTAFPPPSHESSPSTAAGPTFSTTGPTAGVPAPVPTAARPGIRRGQVITGLLAIAIAVMVAVTQLTGFSIDLEPAQWLLIIGGLSLALGVLGLLIRPRHRHAHPHPHP